MSQTSPAQPGLTPGPGLYLGGCPASGACGGVEPGGAQACFSCPESLLGLMGPRGASHLNRPAA